MGDDNNRDVQFLATLGGLAHLRSQQQQTTELRKQNELAQQRAKAEKEIAEIESKRFELEVKEKELKREVELAEKRIRKQMVSLNQSLEKLDRINLEPGSFINEKTKTIYTHSYGIISKQVEIIEQEDILNELSDLEYFSKLSTSLDRIQRKLVTVGLIEENPKITLKYDLDKNSSLVKKFEKAISDFESVIKDSQTKNIEADMANSVRKSADDLKETLQNIANELDEKDLARDEWSEGVNFSDYLIQFDILTNGEERVLEPSENFIEFLQDSNKYIQKCIDRGYSVRKLLETISNLEKELEDAWQLGHSVKFEKILSQIRNLCKEKSLASDDLEKKFKHYSYLTSMIVKSKDLIVDSHAYRKKYSKDLLMLKKLKIREDLEELKKEYDKILDLPPNHLLFTEVRSQMVEIEKEQENLKTLIFDLEKRKSEFISLLVGVMTMSVLVFFLIICGVIEFF